MLPPNTRRRFVKKQDSAVFSATENFVRLQQSQQEFLDWLEASEKNDPDIDRHAFKKIR